MTEICYSIKQLGHGFYRVSRYLHSFGDIDRSENNNYDEKLSSSLSRSRRIVFEIAMCNHWDYFFTGTLDKNKYDRFDLENFHHDLTRFCRDRGCKFLLIPERHEDGAWHMHGLISGVSFSELAKFVKGVHPWKLVKNGYLNWLPYAEKFGHVSLGKIKSPVGVSYYVTKYLSKSLSERCEELHARLFYSSRNLKRAETVVELYGSNPSLDSFVEAVNEFCATGLVKGKDFTFPLEFLDESLIPQIDVDLMEMSDVDDYAACDQLLIDSYEVGGKHPW